jgi:hypothetical protein
MIPSHRRGGARVGDWQRVFLKGLFMTFNQICGGERVPFFGGRVGGGFALDLREGGLDFLERLVVPSRQLCGIGKFFLQQKFFGDLQAVAAQR